MRNLALDGVRGLAATSVVMHHFVLAMLPQMDALERSPFTAITDSPLGLLFNGAFPVVLFFVLSGYVVSAAAERGMTPVWKRIVLRYVRLGVPALCSTLIAWALIKTFPGGLRHLQQASPDNPWLSTFYGPDPPGLHMAIYEGAVQAFFGIRPRFNAVLWTMKPELMGSMAIFLVYGLTRGRLRWVALALAGLIPLIDRHLFAYEAFLFGCLLREFEAQLPRRLSWPTLILGTAVGSLHFGVLQRQGIGVHPSSIFHVGTAKSVWSLIGAVGVVYAVLRSEQIAAALHASWVQLLGRLSFPIYLVHLPLLQTVIAAVYGTVPLPVVFLAYVSVVLLAAWLIDVLVEVPLLKFLSGVSGRRPPAAADPGAAKRS